MKRCQVCGMSYDPAAGNPCPAARLGRHVPTDRPGMVYVLCFGAPTNVADGDRGHVQPTTHYVGWTGQNPPARRIRQHRVPLESIASMEPGTAEDEERTKRDGCCPQCGARLQPECLGCRRAAK
jgi:rubredoxin